MSAESKMIEEAATKAMKKWLKTDLEKSVERKIHDAMQYLVEEEIEKILNPNGKMAKEIRAAIQEVILTHKEKIAQRIGKYVVDNINIEM